MVGDTRDPAILRLIQPVYLEALQILHNSNDIDMVLTDIRMSEMDGLALLKKLDDFEYPLKAVVISAYGDMKNIRTAMNRGAFDFLTKPIDFEDLETTIDKTLAFVSQLREERRQLQEALEKLNNLVYYDQLTGLPNHNGLIEQIARCLESKEEQDNDFALLMLDVERYSIIKSGFGHSLSDRLIVEVAQRLKRAVNSSTTLARVGESIFAVLWNSLSNLDSAQDSVNHLLKLLEAPLRLDEITVTSAIYAGLALSDLPYAQPEKFLQAADTAMQISKHQDRKNLIVFDTQMQETVIRRLNLEVELQKAIQAQQLSLFYQPIFRLDSREIVGFEALVRWQHPIKGEIPPLTFIPLAEETGLIVPLGEWVLSEACQQLGLWKTKMGIKLPISISVNLSSLQLKSPNLLRLIDENLRAVELDGNALKLEITESVLMKNIKEAMELLSQLRERNIQLSIDDFGTGYSSLSYLRLLPINTLKIDKSFIHGIEDSPTNLDIISAIINLARDLNLESVAEGLEKEEHLDILHSLSCQYGQGFIFSPPLNASDATALLLSQNTCS